MDYIECFCGCGQLINRLDKKKRQRKYVRGHNMKGFVKSESTRLKIGLGNRGKIVSQETRKRIRDTMKIVSSNPMYRKKLSDMKIGSKSHLWRGGITNKNKLIRSGVEFKIWRDIVFKRDEWTCCICGKIGGRIHAHHILNFSSHINLRFLPDNGATLCRDCHRKFHREYGIKNNTLEQFNEFKTEFKNGKKPFC